MKPPVRASLLVCCLVLALPAFALDKQGSAHGGKAETRTSGTNVSGSFMLGIAPYNPSYAARPDNTGLALFRYAAHLDVDLVGQLLSVPLDFNVFTDSTKPGAGFLAPSEFDVIGGLTSTFPAGPGSVELGVRLEHDRPVDRGGFTQTYVDARGRYLFSAADLWPGIAKALKDGDVSGWVTLGTFALNPTYAARPDNTGLALMRYGLHLELSTFGDLFSIGVDGTVFSDRTAAIPIAPSELDFTGEFIFHKDAFEVHLAYERDMPVDRGGMVQQFVYVLGAWSFDVSNSKPRPVEDKNSIISP